jgi:hypothetical protein
MSHLTWDPPLQHAAAAAENVLSHNAKQPSHVSRWVPSYVGHCSTSYLQCQRSSLFTDTDDIAYRSEINVFSQQSRVIKDISCFNLIWRFVNEVTRTRYLTLLCSSANSHNVSSLIFTCYIMHVQWTQDNCELHWPLEVYTWEAGGDRKKIAQRERKHNHFPVLYDVKQFGSGCRRIATEGSCE